MPHIQAQLYYKATQLHEPVCSMHGPHPQCKRPPAHCKHPWDTCSRRARLIHAGSAPDCSVHQTRPSAAGAHTCAPCKHERIHARLLNASPFAQRLLKAGPSAHCRANLLIAGPSVVCSMPARLFNAAGLLDASPPVCPSAPTRNRRALQLQAAGAPRLLGARVCSMYARACTACRRVCSMQARASPQVQARLLRRGRARMLRCNARLQPHPARCRPVCSMQARLPNATTSAQPRLLNAKPVCSKQDRLPNATPSAQCNPVCSMDNDRFWPDGFWPRPLLARAPLTIQYVKTPKPQTLNLNSKAAGAMKRRPLHAASAERSASCLSTGATDEGPLHGGA